MTTETPIDDEVLTIDEAAAILRISRNAAYTLSRKWRATGGRVGLPCIEIGRSVRVRRLRVEPRPAHAALPCSFHQRCPDSGNR